MSFLTGQLRCHVRNACLTTASTLAHPCPPSNHSVSSCPPFFFMMHNATALCYLFTFNLSQPLNTSSVTAKEQGLFFFFFDTCISQYLELCLTHGRSTRNFRQMNKLANVKPLSICHTVGAQHDTSGLSQELMEILMTVSTMVKC